MQKTSGASRLNAQLKAGRSAFAAARWKECREEEQFCATAFNLLSWTKRVGADKLRHARLCAGGGNLRHGITGTRCCSQICGKQRFCFRQYSMPDAFASVSGSTELLAVKPFYGIGKTPVRSSSWSRCIARMMAPLTVVEARHNGVVEGPSSSSTRTAVALAYGFESRERKILENKLSRGRSSRFKFSPQS
jgi:hypothetical protein